MNYPEILLPKKGQKLSDGEAKHGDFLCRRVSKPAFEELLRNILPPDEFPKKELLQLSVNKVPPTEPHHIRWKTRNFEPYEEHEEPVPATSVEAEFLSCCFIMLKYEDVQGFSLSSPFHQPDGAVEIREYYFTVKHRPLMVNFWHYEICVSSHNGNLVKYRKGAWIAELTANLQNFLMGWIAEYLRQLGDAKAGNCFDE